MRGFSLLEVMISLAIAMLLLIAVAQLGVLVEQLWFMQEKSMNRIEALNVAYAWMGRDIESAGYFGCLKQSLRQEREDPQHLLMDSEIEWSNTSLTVQYMSAETAFLVSKISPYQWEVTDTIPWKEGDQVVFEDCMNMAVATIQSVSQHGSHQLLTLNSPLISDFSTEARVGYLRKHQYQVRTTSRKNAQGEPITSLYVLDNYQWQELLEAVRTVSWYPPNHPVTIRLTMMDDVVLTIQVEQKNAP